jgi:hypothetical protein
MDHTFCVQESLSLNSGLISGIAPSFVSDMKKTILFLMTVALGLHLSAQDLQPNQVPNPVKQAIAKQFPKASGIQYGMANSTYQASFYDQGKQCIVTCTANGTVLETDTEITPAQLPKPVSSSAEKNFKGYTIMTAVKRDATDKGICYEMDLKKGNSGYSVRFSDTGEILFKEARKVEINMKTNNKR